MKEPKNAAAIVETLTAEYRRSVTALRQDLEAYLANRTAPDPKRRADGGYAYPAIKLTYAGQGPAPHLPRAFARFSQAGAYSTTVTRPDLFAPYLTEQLSLLLADFEVEVEVTRSDQEIPFPYVLDGSLDLGASEKSVRRPSNRVRGRFGPYCGLHRLSATSSPMKANSVEGKWIASSAADTLLAPRSSEPSST